MNRDRFDRFVDGAFNLVGDAWNEARRDFVCGIDANARMDERENNIALAALAMLDGGLSVEKTIALLQKHWDLRRSEALPFIEWARKRMEACA